jgi:hypothetical protein
MARILECNAGVRFGSFRRAEPEQFGRCPDHHAGTAGDRAVALFGQHGCQIDGSPMMLVTGGDFISPLQTMQHGGSHAPWLLNGDAAARHSDRGKMPQPREVLAIDQQQLSAPDVAVGAEAAIIEHQADDCLVQSMFDADRGDVGMMVLYRDVRYAEPGPHLDGEARGIEIGVQVAGHRSGNPSLPDDHFGRRRLVINANLGRIEVAQYARYAGLGLAGDAERVLPLAAGRHHRRPDTGHAEGSLDYRRRSHGFRDKVLRVKVIMLRGILRSIPFACRPHAAGRYSAADADQDLLPYPLHWRLQGIRMDG